MLNPALLFAIFFTKLFIILIVAGALIGAYISVGLLNSNKFAWVSVDSVDFSSGNTTLTWTASPPFRYDPSSAPLESTAQYTGTISLVTGEGTVSDVTTEACTECITFLMYGFDYQSDDTLKATLGVSINGPPVFYELTLSSVNNTVIVSDVNVTFHISLGSCDMGQDPVEITIDPITR